MKKFLKIVISFFVAGSAIGAVVLAISLGVGDSIEKIKWLKSIGTCLVMMFSPVFLFPFGDLVTIKDGIISPYKPNFLSLVFINGLLYAFLGMIVGLGQEACRGLKYLALGMIGLYWIFCIASSIRF